MSRHDEIVDLLQRLHRMNRQVSSTEHKLSSLLGQAASALFDAANEADRLDNPEQHAAVRLSYSDGGKTVLIHIQRGSGQERQYMYSEDPTRLQSAGKRFGVSSASLERMDQWLAGE